MGYSARRGFTNGKVSGAARQAELQQRIAQMQEQMNATQEAVEAQEFTASVGGGVVVDGKIVAGANGGAGEVGHMTVEPGETVPCACGKYGCLEQYASANGIVRMGKVMLSQCDKPSALRDLERFTAKDICDLARNGEEMAMDIVERFGEATFYVSEEKPDMLTEIKGISYDKAQKISEAFCEQHELRRAMMFLQGFDISPAYAMRIYKKSKSRNN